MRLHNHGNLRSGHRLRRLNWGLHGHPLRWSVTLQTRRLLHHLHLNLQWLQRHGDLLHWRLALACEDRLPLVVFDASKVDLSLASIGERHVVLAAEAE